MCNSLWHMYVRKYNILISTVPNGLKRIGASKAKHKACPPITPHLYTSLISLTSVSQQVQIRYNPLSPYHSFSPCYLRTLPLFLFSLSTLFPFSVPAKSEYEKNKILMRFFSIIYLWPESIHFPLLALVSPDPCSEHQRRISSWFTAQTWVGSHHGGSGSVAGIPWCVGTGSCYYLYIIFLLESFICNITASFLE